MSSASTFKNTLRFTRDPNTAASATANPTFKGTINRDHKGKAAKTWWRKELESRQEVLVECVTGEVYRYLIGGRQPRLRAEAANVVLSEHIPYHSPRDFFDRWPADANARANRDPWSRAFVANLESLALVLVSSMFLEENDLSDQNYGLALVPDEGADDDSQAAALARAAGTRYASFIKIDHGQSLNSLRIADLANHAKFMKRQTGRAMVKYFPVGASGRAEERTKSDRKNILASLFDKRQYALPSHFLSWSFYDFLAGVVDRDYILASEFQPSTFPLFDGRILSLLPLSTADERAKTTDRLEAAKYAAVAKIVFTSDEVYRTIARCAVPQDDVKNLGLIVERIVANKRAVREAVAADPDFFAWVHENRDAVEEAIRSSARRLSSKRDGGESDRYGALATVDPFDATWTAAKKVGEAFAACAADAHATNAFVAETLYAAEHVRASWGGGASVHLDGLLPREHRGPRNGSSVKLPRHAAVMANTLACWRGSSKHRALRTTFSLALLSHQATSTPQARGRSEATASFYRDVDATLAKFAEKHAALAMVFARFRSLGDQVNLFDLAPYVGPRAMPAHALVGPRAKRASEALPALAQL